MMRLHLMDPTLLTSIAVHPRVKHITSVLLIQNSSTMWRSECSRSQYFPTSWCLIPRRIPPIARPLQKGPSVKSPFQLELVRKGSHVTTTEKDVMKYVLHGPNADGLEDDQQYASYSMPLRRSFHVRICLCSNLLFFDAVRKLSAFWV